MKRHIKLSFLATIALSAPFLLGTQASATVSDRPASPDEGLRGSIASPDDALSQAAVMAPGEDVHGCNGSEEVHPRVLVCVKSYGDKVYVKDRMTDGLSAVAKVLAPFVNGPGGVTYRYCTNSLGSGKWGVCNWDFIEESYVDYWGGTRNGSAGGDYVNRTRGHIESTS